MADNQPVEMKNPFELMAEELDDQNEKIQRATWELEKAIKAVQISRGMVRFRIKDGEKIMFDAVMADGDQSFVVEVYKKV